MHAHVLPGIMLYILRSILLPPSRGVSCRRAKKNIISPAPPKIENCVPNWKYNLLDWILLRQRIRKFVLPTGNTIFSIEYSSDRGSEDMAGSACLPGVHWCYHKSIPSQYIQSPHPLQTAYVDVSSGTPVGVHFSFMRILLTVVSAAAYHMYRSLTLPFCALIFQGILLVCTCASGFVVPSAPITSTGRTGSCSSHPVVSNSVRTSSSASFSSSLFAEAQQACGIMAEASEGEFSNATLYTSRSSFLCVREIGMLEPYCLLYGYLATVPIA